MQLFGNCVRRMGSLPRTLANEAPKGYVSCMSQHTQKFHLAAVMGWPVMHSRSPRLHNHWLKRYGIEGIYVPLAVEPGKVEAALRALPALNFAGVNVTLPHKEEILRIADWVDPVARAIGAANCVVVQPDDTLHAYNFDAFGFVQALKAGAPGWLGAQGPAVVIGAGGAARAVVYGLVAEGAPEVRLVNRTFERAQALAAEFGPTVKPLRWDARAEALDGAALLVNTTSNGMIGQPPLDLALDALPREAVVDDIVYTPLETPLLAAARARGNICVDGLGMLIHQARPAFEHWFGVAPEVTPEVRALMEAPI